MAGIRHRRRVDQGQVQAHAKAGRSMRDGDRVGGRRSSHHQAGRRQHALGVADLDRLVDLARGTEVIGRDDQALRQETIMSSRVRRNWKNSMPSRRRRTSMSLDVSISPTISAILDGRK